MRLDTLAFRQLAAAAIPYRVTLRQNETYRLPRRFPIIAVISGCAWITFEGKDILLRAGERLSFDLNRDTPVITAVGQHEVILEPMLRATSESTTLKLR